MWSLDPKRIEYFSLYQNIANSSFDFPRLPPSIVRPSGGLSKTGRLKDDIVRDNASMLAKLFDYHTRFQHHASGLFDLAPVNQFGFGHPLHSRMNAINDMQSENEQLKKENAALKHDLEKSKKK